VVAVLGKTLGDRLPEAQTRPELVRQTIPLDPVPYSTPRRTMSSAVRMVTTRLTSASVRQLSSGTPSTIVTRIVEGATVELGAVVDGLTVDEGAEPVDVVVRAWVVTTGMSVVGDTAVWLPLHPLARTIATIDAHFAIVDASRIVFSRFCGSSPTTGRCARKRHICSTLNVRVGDALERPCALGPDQHGGSHLGGVAI
jgi:hypothetical protein